MNKHGEQLFMLNNFWKGRHNIPESTLWWCGEMSIMYGSGSWISNPTIHNLGNLPFFGTQFPHLKNESFALFNLSHTTFKGIRLGNRTNVVTW